MKNKSFPFVIVIIAILVAIGVFSGGGNTSNEIPDAAVFDTVLKQRQAARAEGDIDAFNSFISQRALQKQLEIREGVSDEAFADNLRLGYQQLTNPDVTNLPLVEIIPEEESVLVVYEGPIVIAEGDERIVTRLVRFVMEDGEWKIDEDFIDYRGNQPRVMQRLPTISAEPIEQ